MKKYTCMLNEKYQCGNCQKDYTSDEIDELENFRCPECGVLLIIKSPRSTLPDRFVERKLPHEIVEGDDILLREDDEYHEVLGTKVMSNNRTKFMLRGFGGRIFNNDEFVNCLARRREY